MAEHIPGSLPAAPKGEFYINGLDGIRALAFLMVFGAHATPGPISRLVPATLGVTIFFFLSGYLITTLLRRETAKTGTVSLKDFYIRRALRIFIPMWIAYAFASLVGRFAFHWPTGNVLGFASIFLYFENYAEALKAAISIPIGMGVTWSLCVEEHFYLLFPVLFLLFLRRRLSARAQALVLAGLCVLDLLWRIYVLTFTTLPHGWTYIATDSRFDSILFGCLLAIRNNPKLNDPSPLLRRYAGPLAVSGLLMLAVSMMVESPAFRQSFRYSVQGIALYLIFFFILATPGHWGVRWLEIRALRYLGWVSYSMYLIHVFFLDALMMYFPGKLWLTAPLGLTIALLYCVVIRHAVELPLQNLRARFRHVASIKTAPELTTP